MNNIWILAQADSSDSSSGVTSEQVTSGEEETTTMAPADPNAPAVPTRRGLFDGGGQQFIFIGLMLVMMYLILFRGPRKKQQQHKQMMQELSKNDKIQTLGGIIGTVVDIKDDEITVKIDESNNTKMKILRSAISRNTSKD
ncbi:MAG: preprotein translocase subunit YajC [Planctomycetota bacterium]|nr:preprotein translocase subunit YajC [Planctomycetota bacterium]